LGLLGSEDLAEHLIVLRIGEHNGGVCQMVLRIEGLLAKDILYLISRFLLIHL